MTTAHGERVVPRLRGRLALTEKVVAKIAGQAATEVDGTSGRAGRLLGFRDKGEATSRPKVEVELSGETADLALAVGIPYPGSIRDATQLVREHVTRRVEELTGVDIRRVDIDVAFLTDQVDGTPGVLR